MRFVVVVLAVLLAFGRADDASFEALIAKYEDSQNGMNISLVNEVFRADTGQAWLPMGTDKPVQGADVGKFFAAFFGNFKTIHETVSLVIINGAAAMIQKRFYAVTKQGCVVDQPVLMNFYSADQLKIDFLGGIWNQTALGIQANCKPQ